MSKGKSSVSNAASYKEIGDYWDNHDLADHWEETQPVDFEVDIQSEVIYYPIEATLSTQVRSLAAQRGVSAETLLNLWVQEKLAQETA